MKKLFVILTSLPGMCGAANAETHHWIDSRGWIHYTHNIGSVPKEYRKQVQTRREIVVDDPAIRALMEKERKRAIAIREEALKKARARVRREAEEARQKSPGEKIQSQAKERDAARERMESTSPGKREIGSKGKVPVQRVTEK